MSEGLTRIAIVNPKKCKPKLCKRECKTSCPIVAQGKLCIEVKSTSVISKISETLCIGCGICTRSCPFDSITIINIPKNLDIDTTHRYGPNSFKLHRLPMISKNQIYSLIGENGIGKSSALKIMSGKLIPNFGKYETEATWENALNQFKGTQLQPFFTKLVTGTITALIKPQFVDSIANIADIATKTVRQVLYAKDERKNLDQVIEKLNMKNILDRQVKDLSGGECQIFCVASILTRNADIFMFDEFTSFLDIKQRLRAAECIRDMCTSSGSSETGPTDKYVLIVDHDISVLDYASDSISILYGIPNVYGVVTGPSNVREGINHYLDGFIPKDNLRFRDSELSFKIKDVEDNEDNENVKDDVKDDFKHGDSYSRRYPSMKKSFKGFELEVQTGTFKESEITVILSQNGSGKTTFLNMLAGLTKPDLVNGKPFHEVTNNIPSYTVSVKPQKINPKWPGTVRELLHNKSLATYTNPQFVTDVIKPLGVDKLMDEKVQTLSGGQLQVLAITLSLSKSADLYLIDEPSSYLDSAMRLTVCKVIKRFMMHNKKSAFIIEHDFLMSVFLADRIMNFSGTPAVSTVALTPCPLSIGMNYFLKSLNVTFRRDENNRPRINKLNSVKHMEQVKSGVYFYLDDDKEPTVP